VNHKLRAVVPAALAAGGLLLAACGSGDTSSAPSSAPSTTPSTTTSTTTVSVPASTSDTATSTPDSSVPSGTPGAADGLAPVDCGEVTMDTGVAHRLIATPAEGGIVGCTEAFTVVDEFLALPPEKRAEASLGDVLLPSGWSCTVDDGATANLGCAKDGFTLHTEQQG
jgi:hypothetical protein